MDFPNECTHGHMKEDRAGTYYYALKTVGMLVPSIDVGKGQTYVLFDIDIYGLCSIWIKTAP